MAHDVFISHAHQDKTVADAACATLESAGIRCWIAPRDIPPGSEWGDAIVGAIKSSRALVLIFSTSSNLSPQIRREVERAVDGGLTIIPLRIEAAEPAGSLAYFMAGVHWLDAMTPPLQAHLDHLVATLGALLKTPATQSETPSPTTQPVDQRKYPHHLNIMREYYKSYENNFGFVWTSCLCFLVTMWGTIDSDVLISCESHSSCFSLVIISFPKLVFKSIITDLGFVFLHDVGAYNSSVWQLALVQYLFPAVTWIMIVSRIISYFKPTA